MSDRRRVERLITFGTALVLYPGRSIPQLFASRSDVKAAYQLLARPEAAPDALQASHRSLVDQHYRVRTPQPSGEPKKASPASTGRERKSQIWDRERAHRALGR